MNTIMFVETEENKGKLRVGFRLHKYNLKFSPKGVIRIARFNSCFHPLFNLGYYADTYFNQLIRKYKKYYIEKKKKEIYTIFQKKFCNDILLYILQYI